MSCTPSSGLRPGARRTVLAVIDPRSGAQQLMRVARFLEANGDTISAIVAYRQVILAGEPSVAEEARRRVEELARRAWPGRPG